MELFAEQDTTRTSEYLPKCHDAFEKTVLLLFQTNGKTARLAQVSKGWLKVVPQQTRLAGLPNRVPAKVASGRIRVSPHGVLWVINVGFFCLQTDSEGAMQMGVNVLGNILMLKTFTGELEHLLSVLHELYQRGCRWLVVGVKARCSQIPTQYLVTTKSHFLLAHGIL